VGTTGVGRPGCDAYHFVFAVLRERADDAPKLWGRIRLDRGSPWGIVNV
jgi:hypothetical protein